MKKGKAVKAVKAVKPTAEKPKGPRNLEYVEHYDTGYGIALDEAGDVYRYEGDEGEYLHPEKLTLPEALEWLATMDDLTTVGSSPNHPRFFRLLAAKLRDSTAKPERPVSELESVQSFNWLDNARPEAHLLADANGCYYVSEDDKTAKRVTLGQAMGWLASKTRESIDGGGFSASESLPDFFAKVAEKLPEGV